MEPDVLSRAVRWLLERIESFPIPLEEALWVYTYVSPDAVECSARAKER
jgi:hypothetical protein